MQSYKQFFATSNFEQLLRLVGDGKQNITIQHRGEMALRYECALLMRLSLHLRSVIFSGQLLDSFLLIFKQQTMQIGFFNFTLKQGRKHGKCPSTPREDEYISQSHFVGNGFCLVQQRLAYGPLLQPQVCSASWLEEQNLSVYLGKE